MVVTLAIVEVGNVLAEVTHNADFGTVAIERFLRGAN